MKLISVIFIAVVIFSISGCSKSNETPDMAPPIDTTFNPANATLLKQGLFAGNMNYAVSGSVKLYDYQGRKYIYFENFSSSNGPDLKVYVATTNAASQFINVGDLKGTTGMQAYLINTPPDFNQYNKVLIWCQQFSALFGASTLQ